MLETLVAESPQGTREKLERLIRATAATLQSLAASFDDPGNLVLPEMPCLKDLSIYLRPPGRGNLGNTGVASALATISSAPATLEHIFLHLMTSPQYKDRNQWQELDAIMAGMPCLRRITIIDYTPGFFAGGLIGNQVSREPAEAERGLAVLRGELDVCRSKGLIEVKRVEGAALILPDMPSLTTLSLGLEWSKDDPNVLVLPLVTIFSAPTTLKHIFFHVTQDVFESEEEDSDPEDWEALDASIMAMPRLSRIAFVVTLGYSVRDGGESMFFASSERSEEQAREGANNAMRYLEARLPACYEKGIVEVEMTSVSRKFCDDAFLGSDIGPIFWEE
ncbi:hypothetical protein CGCF245_v014884 [Colletotrichum fructicola]|nr:hypothetical protein CGCF245_v014884 [Colletotrichum fructicola]